MADYVIVDAIAGKDRHRFAILTHNYRLLVEAVCVIADVISKMEEITILGGSNKIIPDGVQFVFEGS